MTDRVTLFRRLAPIVLAGCVPCSLSLLAQAPHPLTSADQQRVDAIVHKMTMAEKLDYIGGTGFAVRAMPALHLPALEMSDGPIGVRSNAGFPSTTYAGGIGLAASWDRALAARVGAGKAPTVIVAFDVTNTGTRKGAEVAQVYVSDNHAKIERPERELKGFERVELAPGETKHVSIALHARSFAYYSVEAKKWVIDPGKFTVHVGDSVESTPLKGSVEVTREMANAAF